MRTWVRPADSDWTSSQLAETWRSFRASRNSSSTATGSTRWTTSSIGTTHKSRTWRHSRQASSADHPRPLKPLPLRLTAVASLLLMAKSLYSQVGALPLTRLPFSENTGMPSPGRLYLVLSGGDRHSVRNGGSGPRHRRHWDPSG